MNSDPYKDIRPYTDAELRPALERIAEWDLFPQVARYIYPDMGAAEAKTRLRTVDSVLELQATFMNDAIKKVIASTMDAFTCSGVGYLRKNQSYLFVSNHRDITLDAFLLQHVLLERMGDTSYIVFGDNLLSSPTLADMFRANKLIQMGRGGAPREFYNSLVHLSKYIRQLVVEERHSVWIAQRNGRSKNGVDSTAPAVMKMLMLGGGKDAVRALAELHIVPVGISYEWDPCDAMKAREVCLRRLGDYQKGKDEDFNSVVTGIIAPKGRVHLAIGRPLTEAELEPQAGEDLARHVAGVLDGRIQGCYRLMPTNYLAFDMLEGSPRYRSRYTAALRHQFEQRLERVEEKEWRQAMVEMYANPVLSALEHRKLAGA